MPELAPTRSPASPGDIAATFVDALRELGNASPGAELVAVLMAHSSHETARWKWLRGHSLGNVKASDSYVKAGGEYTYYLAGETLSAAAWRQAKGQAKDRTDGKPGLDVEIKRQHTDGRVTAYFYPSHPQARFRAYRSLEDGAHAWLKMMLTGRYGDAVRTYAAAGDPAGYAAAIRAKGYFTAKLGPYQASLVKLHREYLPVARKAITSPPSDPVITTETPKNEPVDRHPFADLLDTGRLVSDPADCVLHGAGLLELESGAKVAKLGVWDKRHETFARLDKAGRQSWLKAHGMRLATPAELEERKRRSIHVKFRPRVFTSADTHHMASHRWCAQADADLLQDAIAAGWDGSQAIDNPKTWCQPEGAIIGLWRHAGDSPTKDQQLSLYHANDPAFTDYATLLVPAVDADHPQAGEPDETPDTLDSDLTHRERIVEWLLARVGVAERPLGSNKGPEVRIWLKGCQRDGYGPEFGQYLASAGANWCAALASAADVATRLPGDPTAVHAYRCSGLELENDAKAAGAWHDVTEVLDGSWTPQPADIAIYKSGNRAWRRHVVTVVELEGQASYRGVGGNEGNMVRDAGGRRYDHPQLMGFIELPRVEEPDFDDSQLRRAVELERKLWAGVVGMDAYDELVAELQEADPRDDGEEVLC